MIGTNSGQQEVGGEVWLRTITYMQCIIITTQMQPTASPDNIEALDELHARKTYYHEGRHRIINVVKTCNGCILIRALVMKALNEESRSHCLAATVLVAFSFALLI
jgi:hypothetical protein